jgi:hypothetical protein
MAAGVGSGIGFLLVLGSILIDKVGKAHFGSGRSYSQPVLLAFAIAVSASIPASSSAEPST